MPMFLHFYVRLRAVHLLLLSSTVDRQLYSLILPKKVECKSNELFNTNCCFRNVQDLLLIVTFNWNSCPVQPEQTLRRRLRWVDQNIRVDDLLFCRLKGTNGSLSEWPKTKAWILKHWLELHYLKQHYVESDAFAQKHHCCKYKSLVCPTWRRCCKLVCWYKHVCNAVILKSHKWSAEAVTLYHQTDFWKKIT